MYHLLSVCELTNGPCHVFTLAIGCETHIYITTVRLTHTKATTVTVYGS